MSYRLTPRAILDLDEIAVYISLENPEAAVRLLSAIERRIRQLVEQPHLGLARSDVAPGVRHLVAGRYLVLYRVADDGVEVLRVLHGSRRVGPHNVE